MPYNPITRFIFNYYQIFKKYNLYYHQQEAFPNENNEENDSQDLWS
jgi:hypothetical protein